MNVQLGIIVEFGFGHATSVNPGFLTRILLGTLPGEDPAHKHVTEKIHHTDLSTCESDAGVSHRAKDTSRKIN